MARWIYDTLELLLGSGLVKDTQDWMTSLFTGILKIMSEDTISSIFNCFAAISISLLILFFYINLTQEASREMFSIEKLMVAFIKLIVAVAVLACLPEIIVNIVKLGQWMYGMAADDLAGIITTSAASKITFLGQDTSQGFPEWDTVSDQFEAQFGGVLSFMNNLGLVFKMIFPTLILFIAKIIAYFITTTNAVKIVVRGVFTPIAIVQLFANAGDPAGLRYLKKFAAECITMAVIVVLMAASSALSAGIIPEINITSCSEISAALKFGDMVKICVPHLVCVGGMAGCSMIAGDIVGA